MNESLSHCCSFPHSPIRVLGPHHQGQVVTSFKVKMESPIIERRDDCKGEREMGKGSLGS